MNLISGIYVIQDLENTGKKRIEFLIHKSWQTKKVISKRFQSGLIALLSFIMCSCKIENVMSWKREDVWLKPDVNKC